MLYQYLLEAKEQNQLLNIYYLNQIVTCFVNNIDEESEFIEIAYIDFVSNSLDGIINKATADGLISEEEAVMLSDSEKPDESDKVLCRRLIRISDIIQVDISVEHLLTQDMALFAKTQKKSRELTQSAFFTDHSS